MGNTPMVSPVTGPFTTNGSRSMKGPGSYAWNKTKYKQAKPYDLPLIYVFHKRVNLSTNYASTSPDNASSSNSNWRAGGTRYIGATDSATYDARFRAMEKFRGAVGERAEWLVNLQERNQAIDMITRRSLQLLNLATAVFRRNWKEVNRHLSVPKGYIPKAKSAGGAWLEYHFGWEPMIQDVYTGIDILQRPIKDKEVYGIGKSHDSPFDRTDTSNYYTTSEYTLTVFARVAAMVECDNPNLWRANQLGLVNPASIAWEMVPFSFVVDWFVPVSQFLNSYTEFLGLKVTRQYTSTLSRELIDYQLVPKTGALPYGHAVNGSVSMNRVLSLPASSLRPPSLRTLSLTRAATAISLLLQQLKS